MCALLRTHTRPSQDAGQPRIPRGQRCVVWYGQQKHPLSEYEAINQTTYEIKETLENANWVEKIHAIHTIHTILYITTTATHR